MIPAFLLLVLLGCKDFETKKISSEEALNEQLSHFNWNSVDVYPSFAECQELMEKPDLKICFERILIENLHNELSKYQIVTEDSIRETATLFLLISAEGKPKIDSLLLSEKLRTEVPELKNWLEASIQNLPTIFPARTRGIPVATKFILPIQVVAE